MSMKQGPRSAGMRPSAIAFSRRHDAFGNFTAIMRGEGMCSWCLPGFSLQGVNHGD